MPVEVFLDFRRYLDTASGRQSKQFYIIKYLLGFHFSHELGFLKIEDKEAVHSYFDKQSLFDFYKECLKIEQEGNEDIVRAAMALFVKEKKEGKEILRALRDLIIVWKAF